MPSVLVNRDLSRVDTLELKNKVVKKIGRMKANKYFNLVMRFLSFKISKSEFEKMCIGIIGRENVCLHNHIVRSIIHNVHIANTPPLNERKMDRNSLRVKVGNLQNLCKDFPQSPRRGRTPNTRDRKFKDRPSPLGPFGKGRSIQEQQTTTEFLSIGSIPPGSVEDGEEVEQTAESPSIHSRSPLRAPLGLTLNAKGTRKSAYYTETCYISGELPDTNSLKKQLEKNLEAEGLTVSVDCINILNNSLDVFLKRLIKPCLEIADSRSRQARPGLNEIWPVRYGQKPNMSVSASMLDFRVAMELNPPFLGYDWPTKFEKVCLGVLEE